MCCPTHCIPLLFIFILVFNHRADGSLILFELWSTFWTILEVCGARTSVLATAALLWFRHVGVTARLRVFHHPTVGSLDSGTDEGLQKVS